MEKLCKDIVGYDEKSYKRAIKIDVRLTYLMAVDTLFELVFALLPDKKGNLRDKEIVSTLSSGKQYYSELREYVNNRESRFDILKDQVNYTGGKSCTALRYIFYDGLFETEHEKEIVESVDAISEALKFFGKEINENRDELNAYKHGLRVVPFFNTMSFKDPKTGKGLEIDMSESISFLTENKSERTIHAKPLDYKKDIALTIYVTHLINNIIALRQRQLTTAKNFQTSISALKKTSLDEARKSNIQMGNFKLNLPIA
ncbi:hypothetical protein EJ994_13890 [Maribacter sp. MJ134]|jgi:hypothetical protein|uniref:hypothetical protein n=1 Tax=unclassified Maribacter TaxID=2615042 RepID=UPI000F830E91|nr:hypothetical protein [Maribacter sp. MJ134]AZQ59835.1 hypothetical protein EJ994_13890 [Maribacter sp. MJ134]